MAGLYVDSEQNPIMWSHNNNSNTIREAKTTFGDTKKASAGSKTLSSITLTSTQFCSHGKSLLELAPLDQTTSVELWTHRP
jgi:hypothetical protein